MKLKRFANDAEYSWKTATIKSRIPVNERTR